MGLRLCIKDTSRLTNLPSTDKNVLKVKSLEDLRTIIARILLHFYTFCDCEIICRQNKYDFAQ